MSLGVGSQYYYYLAVSRAATTCITDLETPFATGRRLIFEQSLEISGKARSTTHRFY